MPLTPDLRYVIPVVLQYFYAKEGHVRPEARFYSRDLTADMKVIVKDAFEQSGLVATERVGVGLRLKVKINHLYGITHASQTARFGASSTRTFGPYGYAEAQLEMSDTSGKLIGTRRIVGVFNPNIENMRAVATGSVVDALTLAAVNAATNLARNAGRAA